MSGPSVKIAAEWFERDDVETIGEVAVLFHLSALAYSARQSSDGFIPTRQLRRLWTADVDEMVSKLTEVGWWERVDGGYRIPGWKDFILSAGEVDRLKTSNNERQERFRRHNRDDHSMCDRCSAVKRNALRNGVTNAVINGDPVRSAPIRNEVEERRGRTPTASASAGAPASASGAASDRDIGLPPPEGFKISFDMDDDEVEAS